MNEQELPDNRDKLFPQKGMRLVNALFLLSMFFYKSGFMWIAYLAWIVYLLYRIRHAEKGESKTAYYVLIALAVVIMCVNLRYAFGG